MTSIPDFSPIELLAIDIDGTLTNGKIYWLGSEWGWAQQYHTRDGEALLRAASKGLRVIPISRNKTACARVRIESLGLSTRWLASADKLASLQDVCAHHGIGLQQVCFVGDGFEDAAIFEAVGIGVAVSDAHPHAKKSAAWITTAAGGERALEEVVAEIGRAKRWEL